MNRKTLTVALAAAVLILGALFWAFFAEPPGAPGGGGGIRTRFTSPHFVGYHEGVRQWSLRAETIEEGDGADGTFVLHGISEGVLYRDGSPHLRFRADRGTWRREGGDLRLEGNVRFYEGETEVLSSEVIEWYADEERLVSPVRVRALYDGQRVEADALDARIKDETALLTGNVVWVTPEGIEVRAERAEYAQDRLVFSGLLAPVRFRPPDGAPEEGARD